MPFKISLTKTDQKEFRKLSNLVQKQALKGMEKTLENPYSGRRLQGKLEGLWRCRVGKYRIIYMIDEHENAVVFLDVGLRKAIYEQ